MRRVLVVVGALSLVLAACSTNPTPAANPSSVASATASTLNCDKASLSLKNPGQLTVATDSPAFPPWVLNNNPSSGQGYEAAVAYAIAQQLGFSISEVKWVVEPFNKSYAPGPKDFDFDVNEISVTPQRQQAVTFSDSYYDVTQALVAMKDGAIVTSHAATDLPSYVYGAQIGTTSLAFIQQNIQPTKQPAVFDTTNDAKSALQNGRIDALVLDLPTAAFVSSDEIKGSVLVGQFPSTGEHYGLLFEKDNPLVACVNKSLAELKSDGTLQRLQQQYLSDYLKVPTVQP